MFTPNHFIHLILILTALVGCNTEKTSSLDSTLILDESPTVLGRPVQYLVVFDVLTDLEDEETNEQLDFSFNPKPFTGQTVATSILNGHLMYMQEVKASGHLSLGGPLMDRSTDLAKLNGAVFVYNGSSEEEVIEIINKDPFISEGLMSISYVRPLIDLAR